MHNSQHSKVMIGRLGYKGGDTMNCAICNKKITQKYRWSKAIPIKFICEECYQSKWIEATNQDIETISKE